MHAFGKVQAAVPLVVVVVFPLLLPMPLPLRLLGVPFLFRVVSELKRFTFCAQKLNK